MRFETVHGCAVPAKLAAEVRLLAEKAGATLNSCDRSRAAEPILRANGKKSQAELYECFQTRQVTGVCPAGCGSCNPANRPGRSTHERRSDGVAYPGPAGRRLRYWQVGMDWSDPNGVLAAARERDWRISVTYPDNPQESHHLNLRKKPVLTIVPTLELGASGLWVVRLTRRLAFITRPGPYLASAQRRFTATIRSAVRLYQVDHGLPDTGIVNAAMWNQLAVSVRRERRRRRKEAEGPTSPPSTDPASRRLQGPDVSKWQADVDWQRVRRAGCEFTFVRIADGDVRDPRFGPGRCTAVREARLLLGVYYYGRVASEDNDQRDGKAEARMAFRFAKEGGWGQRGDLRFAYDFEETNGQGRPKAARHLMQFVREYEEIAGEKPIVYTAPDFFSEMVEHLSVGDRAFLADCPLWIAHWRTERPTIPDPWRTFAVWQHNDRGTVPGISGPCDVNVTRKDFDMDRLRLREAM